MNIATASYSFSERMQEYTDEPETQYFTKTQQNDEYRKKWKFIKVTGMSLTYNPWPSIILALFFNDGKHWSIQLMLYDP